MVRSEGLEPPRCYSLPPQGSASTNSATSAERRSGIRSGRRFDGAHVTNRNGGDKARLPFPPTVFELPAVGGPRQHLLDFDADPVAVDDHHAAGDRQVVGQHLDLVLLGRVEFDDGPATEAHHLMNGHRGGSQDHHQIHGDFIEGWHFPLPHPT